jgi:hypothetical protein
MITFHQTFVLPLYVLHYYGICIHKPPIGTFKLPPNVVLIVTKYYYCICTPTGHYEEAQLPYYDAVPMDPSFEDMKKAVVIDKRRPILPNRWSQSEVSGYIAVLFMCCIIGCRVGVVFL